MLGIGIGLGLGSVVRVRAPARVRMRARVRVRVCQAGAHLPKNAMVSAEVAWLHMITKGRRTVASSTPACAAARRFTAVIRSQ